MSFTSGGGIQNWRHAVDLFNKGFVTPDEVDFAHSMHPLEGFQSSTMTPGEQLIKSVGNRHNLRAIVNPQTALPPGPSMLGLPAGPAGPIYQAPIRQGVPRALSSGAIPMGSGAPSMAGSAAVSGVGNPFRPSSPLAGIAGLTDDSIPVRGAVRGTAQTAGKGGVKEFIKSMGKKGIGGKAASVAGSSVDDAVKGAAEGGFKSLLTAKGLKGGLKGGLYGIGAQAIGDAVVPTKDGSWQDFVKDVGISTGVGAAVGGGVPGAAIGFAFGVGGWLLDKAMSDDEKAAVAEIEDPEEQALTQIYALGERTGTDPNLLKQIASRYQVNIAQIHPLDENGNERSEEDLAGEFETYRQDALDTLAEVAGYNEESMYADQMQAPQMTPQMFDNILSISNKFMSPYIEDVRRDPHALATMLSMVQSMPYAVMQEQAKMYSDAVSSQPTRKIPKISDFTGKR